MSDCKLLKDDDYIPPIGTLGLLDIAATHNGPLWDRADDPGRIAWYKKRTTEEHERCQPCKISELEISVRRLESKLDALRWKKNATDNENTRLKELLEAQSEQSGNCYRNNEGCIIQ